MEELEILTINDKDYAVIDRIEEYLYLCNIEDETDFFIRKSSQNQDELLPLNDDNELNKALELFAKKHENDPEED